MPFYDIGTPGTPWGRDERATWLSRQVKHRDFGADVGRRIAALAEQMDVFQYGTLEYAVGRWPLFALRSRSAGPGRPTALITGGVHGYETSGVHGALRFAEAHAADHAAAWNLVMEARTAVSAGGVVVVVASDPAEREPVERDLRQGRGLAPVTWAHLLERAGAETQQLEVNDPRYRTVVSGRFG